MTYKPSQTDIQDLCACVRQKFQGYDLPEGFTIELDHAILKSFAIAMGKPRSEGAVVFVPGFANAVRTNDKELILDFSNFD